MAEGIGGFLVGGVGGILKPLLRFLANLAGKEIGLLWNAKENLRKLHDTLEVILASVSEAEKQQVSNEVARLWLKNLKHIAYDAEDVVEEIAYETMRQHVRGESPVKKLLDFFSLSNHLVFSYQVAKKVQDINERLDEFKKNNKITKFPTSITAHNETSLQGLARETSPRVPQSIEGREADKNKIIRMLITSTGPSSSEVSSSASSAAVSTISVVGMGGVGKTTLAGLIYKDKAVENFDPKIWVCVGGDFVARTVLLDILKSINPETNLNNSSALVTLENQVEEQLRGKKYLLVLDDMWNVRADEWEKFTRGLTAGVLAGSKVLITSREVQKSVNGGIPSYKLKRLEDEECWSIIKTKAFLNGGAQQTDGDMIRIGRKIANKCKGLPLAAQSLGSLMYLQNKKSDWENIRDNDSWNDKENDQFDVIPILKLSYDDFPSELKQCFSYCSLFPKNWEISRLTLVQLWIAEGFLATCKLEKGRSIEEIADKFFDRLVWSSFLDGVQKSFYLDDIKTCKMHDLVHDLAKAVSGDQELTSLKVSELNDNTSKIRRLHLTLDADLPSTFLKSLSNSNKLRTLIIPEGSNLDLVDPFLFSYNNQYLRILNVDRGSPYDRPKWRSLSVLKHLRYLRLCNLNLRKVVYDQSIGKLYNLETLVLSQMGINVQILLSNIQSLKKLRYLEVSFTDMVELPDSVTSLSNLQTLDLNNCELKVIPDSISSLKNLRFLNLSSNPFEKLPVSVVTLSNLETLDVNSCENLKTLPESVAGLSSLRIFDFQNCPLLKALPIDIETLTNLRCLNLAYTGITELPKSCVNLYNLEYIHLYLCEPPKNVQNWTNLRRFYYLRGNPEYGLGKLIFLEELIYRVPKKRREGNQGIEELRNLNSLVWMNIMALENVKEVDAERENLKAKHKLRELGLHWEAIKEEMGVRRILDQKSSNFQVLEALRPPTGLRMLGIYNYKGSDLPKWMCDLPSALPNLDRLVLENCINIELPAAIWQLRHLKCLELIRMSLKSLDIGGFSSLLELKLTDMFLLEELCYSSYPCLQYIKISGSKRLKEIPSFPCLGRMDLEKVDHKLVSSIGRNHTSLTSIRLDNIVELTYFPISILQNNSNLQELVITKCNLFKDFGVDKENMVAPYGPQLCNGCSLQKLEFIDCPVLSFLPDLRGWTSLRELLIFNCPQLKESLTYDLIQLLDFVKVLQVDFIQRDEVLRDPSNLDALINFMKKLAAKYIQ